MPYHIDEENSELAFEVREGNKLVIKIKSNIFSDSLELYLIKVGDNTEPTDKNVFSSLRVLKEIENLHDTILKEINSVTSGFWELKQDSQGNEYIATKYNVLTEGGLTTYGLGEQKLGTIYDGLPIDNDTIYWETVEGSRVLKAKGSGGEAGSVQWGNISGKPTWIEDTKPTYNWSEIQGEKPFYTKEEIASKYVTIDTEQEITALKHFTAGLSVGESKKKIYEENGVVYIDADVAVTGAMTFYASAGRSVSTIMDAVTVDGITIKKENNVLKAVAGAGSSFDENAMWSALSGSSDNQINKSHLTTALDGYATQNWVIENYATKSELSAVSNKLSDFLEGSDTDNIINKWKELEAFLSGMAETDNLAEILETKADKKYVDSTFVTLSTKQTITGEKTFSSVLNTAAIKASGAITAPSLAVSDWVTIAGIKLRKLEDGALMLEGNLALTGALTMYASNGQSFDTIYDGLPIDNDTIYWQEVDGSRVLKARGGSGSSFDKSAMWTALAGSTTEQINKSHLTTALTGYATESWVSGKNYAVKATTLAGYGITDGVNDVSVTGTGNAVTDASVKGHILTLTKGSTFSLSGHKHAWADITSGKPTTLSGYGITDAPTKTGGGASGTWAINITGTAGAAHIADSAVKLQNVRRLWGNNFDGTGDVTGQIVAYNGIYLPYGGEISDEYGNILRTSYDSASGYNDYFEITAIGSNKIGRSLRGGNSGLLTWGGNRFIFNSYGVGWYVEDGEWMRTYNNLFVPLKIQCNGNIDCGSNITCRTLQANALDIAYGTNYKFVRMSWNGTSGDVASFFVPGSTSQWFTMELRSNGVLYTNGNILAEGGGTYYGSDIRYKSIIQQVELSLLAIANAPSFIYRWNKHGMNQNRLNLGGSAQYAQKILPWAVNDNDNFLSMDYATVAYTFAVHTARHLMNYESKTDKKIKKLENRVKYLEKQLKKLGYEEVRTLDDQSV